jgi:hypothetical protein
MLDKVNWSDVKRKGVRQRGKLVSWLKDAVMTDVENSVRAATSVEPYGPTQRELAEIASATHNAEEYPLVMSIIWSRLNDKGRYWRRVYKALDLLRYLLLHGSPRVLEEARAALPHLEVLQEFRYFDQTERRDCGLSVRQKAKVVVEITQADLAEAWHAVQICTQAQRAVHCGLVMPTHRRPAPAFVVSAPRRSTLIGQRR